MLHVASRVQPGVVVLNRPGAESMDQPTFDMLPLDRWDWFPVAGLESAGILQVEVSLRRFPHVDCLVPRRDPRPASQLRSAVLGVVLPLRVGGLGPRLLPTICDAGNHLGCTLQGARFEKSIAVWSKLLHIPARRRRRNFLIHAGKCLGKKLLIHCHVERRCLVRC